MGSQQLRWKVEDDSQQRLFLTDDEVRLESRKDVGTFSDIEFLHVRAQTIINEVPGGALAPFRHTINAYRGCSHACVYCFARPTHAYLDLDIGRDFETKIVVKVNAIEKVRAELKHFTGEGIAMGTNTDPYQRAEGKYRLTRSIIEELASAQVPFSILTKGTLITRDIDVLTAAARRTNVQVSFSIPTVDTDVWRTTEPGTPHPLRRIAALARLADAGLECGVLMAPILPGLSDRPGQMLDVAQRCVDAGASWLAASGLHLKPGVKEHWMQWLAESHPQLVDSYRSKYADDVYLSRTERSGITQNGRVAEAKARNLKAQVV